MPQLLGGGRYLDGLGGGDLVAAGAGFRRLDGGQSLTPRSLPPRLVPAAFPRLSPPAPGAPAWAVVAGLLTLHCRVIYGKIALEGVTYDLPHLS